ncbi:hypothetical protein [Pseudomonas sp. Gutcm_11s]|uniref:hypothetical protein n=1 Tax=Pseudomonas sp. Gutcm_11s TaxID=3026088 RepID=UPI0023601551|nr:hypothetical protein [Pseudomonas sp. Gutcm_11s]MDD0843550.1 hypothetical protein [Pseudomonas sp. Gutcm_11s]
MEAESVIFLAISSWFLVAAAMLWGMLRVVRRHAQDAHAYHAPAVPREAPTLVRRKPRRPKPPRPILSPALRAAQHFAHR